MLHHRLFALTLTALAVVPATTFAASATQTGYGETPDVEVQPEATQSDSTPTPESNPTTTAAPAATGSSNLPFTGLEAGLIGAAGLGLAGTGFALRRAAREQ